MEILFAIVFIGAAISAGVWYYRAYREARTWTEVHATWGAAHKNRAVAIYNELTRQGTRAQLKTMGGFDITPSMPSTHSSIRVHRDDFVPATRIVLSFTRG